MLDEKSEKGRFPDVANQYGEGPLKLKRFHNFETSKLDPIGYGGLAVILDPLSAIYLKINNNNTGPDAPAIRLDLSEFQKDEKATLQALIVYRDGRCEYEDWSNLNRRVFCLNHKNENFSRIYLVAASTFDKKEAENRSFLLNIYPEVEADCDHNIAVMTLQINGTKKTKQKFKRGTGGFENSYSSWNRYATIKMQLKPWREDIPPQVQSALKRLNFTYPKVKKSRIDTARTAFKSAMRAPRKYNDPHTGCTVLKYRVTSCSIQMSGGVYRTSYTEEHRDSMGLIWTSRGNYQQRVTNAQLDDSTRERLEKRRLEVLVYIDPAKGFIKWVKFPLVGIKTNGHAVKTGTHMERYQDESGQYHYRDNDDNWQKDTTGGMQITFQSQPDYHKTPLDPVWRSKTRSHESASGRGRKVCPLKHQWETYDDTGVVSGSKIIQFRWKLTLKGQSHGS